MSKKEKIYNVFYCWQSDDSNTRYLIKKELLHQFTTVHEDSLTILRNMHKY